MEVVKQVIGCYNFDGFEDILKGIDDETIEVMSPLPGDAPFKHLDVHLPNYKLVIFKLEKKELQYPFVLWACENRYNENQPHSILAVIPSKDKVHEDLPQAIIEHAIFEKPEETFEKRLLERVKELLRCSGRRGLYPMGNISTGLAINYYSVLKVLLSEEFKQEFRGNAEDKSSAVITVILLPNECKIPDDHLEKHLGSKTVVSIKPKSEERIFTGSKYTIKQRTQERDISVDVPNIITTFDKLTKENPGIDPLSRDAVFMHRQEFVRELRILLQKKHENDYILVEFDECDDLKQLIVDELEKFDKRETKQTESSKVLLIKPEKPDEKHADFYKSFERSLIKSNLAVQSLDEGTPGESRMNVFTEKFYEKSTVFAFIENGLLPPLSLDYPIEILDIIQVQSPERRLQLIPVYVGCDGLTENSVYFNLINSLRFSSTTVDTEKGKLTNDGERELVRAAKAATGTNPLNYPIGPVYIGLAWTTCLNYLLPVLPEKIKKLKALAECEEEGVIKFPKILLLGEASYKTTGDLSKLPGFEKVKEIDVTQNATGTERWYATTVYRITHNKKKYLVGVEFVRALACIGEIEQTLQVGLATHDKKEQFEAFGILFSRLINIYEMKCAYCEYDETKCGKVEGKINLANVISNFVDDELHPQARPFRLTHDHSEVQK